MKHPTACIDVFPVTSRSGLNLLAATRLAGTARQFLCDVEVACDGACANAKNILEIATLAAMAGSVLVVTTRGGDASEAMRAIDQLLRTRLFS